LNVRTYLSGLAAGVVLLAAGSSGPAVADDDEYLIGAVVSFSGYMAPYDIPPYQSALLAVDDINAKGGVLGKKLRIIVGDAKTDRALTARKAHELVGEGVEMMIVACDYDEGAPAALVAIDKGMLAYSVCAGDPKMGPQGLGRGAFTASTGAGNQAFAMAEWAYHEKGYRTAYTLLDTITEFHKASHSYFEMAWKQLPDAKLLGTDTFLNDDPSISSQISKIKGLPEQPDFLWISSHVPGFPAAIRQIRAAGIDTPIITVDSLDGNYWIEAVPDASNIYYMGYCSIFGDDPRPKVREWLKAYAGKFGGMPETCFALPGYSLIESWALAVERAGTFETQAVIAELEKFDNEDLLAGLTSFNETTHIQLNRTIMVMQIQNGKFSAITSYQNKNIPPVDYRTAN
jgi:branched-chain amino acid transport system substrate-binding protein